jgi:3-deoxy-7-phosphoheptulonate synthase
MKLVKEQHSKIIIGDYEFGRDLVIIAGPCALESESQMEEIARSLLERKISFLRSDTFKPRTSPYSFQGLAEEGFPLIKKLKEKYPLFLVGEITRIDDLPFYEEYIDIIQIGARNMQNFELLKALSKTKKPLLLKRGFGNTIEEWLLAAEYLLQNGNDQVILCERGIKTFEPWTRNTLDLSSVPLVKGLTTLPVIVDPSHAVGRRDLVKALSWAAIAAGADGLMLEVHPEPDQAISDSKQTIDFEELDLILEKLKKLAPLFGKKQKL